MKNERRSSRTRTPRLEGTGFRTIGGKKGVTVPCLGASSSGSDEESPVSHAPDRRNCLFEGFGVGKRRIVRES